MSKVLVTDEVCRPPCKGNRSSLKGVEGVVEEDAKAGREEGEEAGEVAGIVPQAWTFVRNQLWPATVNAWVTSMPVSTVEGEENTV